MPKNKGKGGKNRRRGKNENENMKRELILKDDGQSYAQVTRVTDEARELKRIREIPDNVNITETSTNNHGGVEDVIFDDRHNSDASSNEEELPRNVNVRASTDDSLSDDDSDDSNDN
ncbi:unnamed protein product [Rotaria socialis]|uniref:Uncharacterized protein n=1 Tax=Rotaria socialis TaxID=392032 RepID=A0A817VZH0_9BILA|nr:unnamed protein product [Rotaria socialis]